MGDQQEDLTSSANDEEVKPDTTKPEITKEVEVSAPNEPIQTKSETTYQAPDIPLIEKLKSQVNVSLSALFDEIIHEVNVLLSIPGGELHHFAREQSVSKIEGLKKLINKALSELSKSEIK